MNIKKLVLTLGVVTIAAVSAIALTTSSAYSLFGDATYVMPGNASTRAVQLVSDGSVASTPAAPYGGIDFAVPSTLTFAQILTLSTDYMFTAGSCGAGSPRFQINVDGKNAFVYIGPPPEYAGCPLSAWANTGNLATPTSIIDTSQLPGGNQYDTFAAADARYGSMIVTGVQLVADAGWAFPSTGQTVQIDNTQINDTLYTYEQPVAMNKNQCKNGGWTTLVDANGAPFKNQGNCIQYVNTGK